MKPDSQSALRLEELVERAAEWARTASGSDVVGWLWDSMPEGSRALFQDAQDFRERVNERIGMKQF